MNLSPMRYKDYVWPHNPRIYEICFERRMAVNNVPFGCFVMQSLGMEHRVLRGDGEFVGEGAYDEFKKLASVFYQDTPGVLVHPIWQSANAYFVSLGVRQEPREDFVSYYFEFWESYDDYEDAIRTTYEPDGGETPAQEAGYHTVVWGDTLWGISLRYGLGLSELISMNPQIKNPNIIRVGDRVMVKRGN